jgi:DNA polymerase-3 subunit epsilon
MIERLTKRLGLRLRFALFFAALGLGGAVLIGAALWFGHQRGGGPVDGFVIGGMIAGLGVLGLSAWIGLLFDENVAKPILALASDLTTRARADVDLQIDESQARHLSTLAPAANAINAALSEARAARQRAVERETARIAREKALFEALFRDLGEGAVVATPDNRVMLYNRMAQELLPQIGLDRPLDAVLRPEPVTDALRRLEEARIAGRASAETFLAASADGKRFLQGRVTPILSDEELSGHVLIFRDATDDLRAHAEKACGALRAPSRHCSMCWKPARTCPPRRVRAFARASPRRSRGSSRSSTAWRRNRPPPPRVAGPSLPWRPAISLTRCAHARR